MDTIVEEIRRGVHGELTGADPNTVQCDLRDFHDESQSIETDRPVQFEVIRIVDLPSLEQFCPIPDGWMLDLLRCPTHERTALGDATDGYDEALVEVTLNDSGAGYTVDASELRLIDYSPASEGGRPPLMPMRPVVRALQCGDFGIFRVSRVQLLVEGARKQGQDGLAAQYATSLDAARMVEASTENGVHDSGH
ncbi:hypothetical protein [Salinigranum halophilum]|uniref:hypothetical protein n=1 Tax=Salinigranum halophilum TaxID=2565931 RepID=UPI0010A79E00|nr:hypothetical protein [Salinigranum halophilum]